MVTSELNRVIRDQLSRARRVLVVSHIRPDGDAIGSLLGIGLALVHKGKEVVMGLVDGVPASFRQLPGANQVVRTVSGDFDFVIVVDCSDLQRTGGILGERTPDLNIDHHITNVNFARMNFVVPEAEATAAVLADHLEPWGLTITENVSRALLTGLVSDTLGFRTSNVTPATLHRAAHLMEHGANLSELYNRALVRRTYEAARFWGEGLITLQKEGRIVWTCLTMEQRSKAGYGGNDDADLINVLSAIDESDIAIIFVEQKDNHTKVSWRAQPGFDVSQLAFSFGGGGHPAASGADIPGSLVEVREKVLAATRLLLQNNNGHASKKSEIVI